MAFSIEPQETYVPDVCGKSCPYFDPCPCCGNWGICWEEDNDGQWVERGEPCEAKRKGGWR